MGYYLLDNPNPYGSHFYPSRRQSCRVIVLHITAGLEDQVPPDASAERTARYAATTSTQVSWHGGSDSDSFLYLLPDEYTAWHARGYNSPTYGWEISKRDTTWSDEPADWVEATLRHAAAGIRPIARKYGIPARLLTRAQVDAGMKGFTYHMWLDPTRRSDPGRDFPINRFFQLLNPPPPPPEEDDMTPDQMAELKAHITAEVERVGRLVWSEPRQDPVTGQGSSYGTQLMFARRSAWQAATGEPPGTPEAEAQACEGGPL